MDVDTVEQWRITQRADEWLASRSGINKSGTDWARHYFPAIFTRPFTFYQKDFWDWIESINPDEYIRPRVECEPRGVGKSTNGEAGIVRLLAKQVKQFCVIISRTEAKAIEHFAAVKSMLGSAQLLADYPHLAPHVDTVSNRITGWKADRIITADGRIVMALTLKSARGLKNAILNARVDFFDFDDIDLETDSPHVIQKNINILKNDIIPAGDIDGETVYLVLQNLIHRDSIVTQIQDHRADILSDRIFCGPYPLLKWYDAEKIDLSDGAKRWVITNGEPYDNAVPLEYAEKLLNRMGKAAFDRECQQITTQIGDDKDFREWNEIYHVSTWAEVEEGFKRAKTDDLRLAEKQFRRLPDRWEVGKGLDWGTTRGHPSVCCYVTRPDERYPFNDIHLVIGEIVMPKYPYDSFEDAEVVSPGRVAEKMVRFEAGLNLRQSQVTESKMSHEASAALNTFLVDLDDSIKQYFQKWKAAKGSGVPQIQNLLEIDYDRPHPFRTYPKGHELEGQPIMGRPRIIFVVENGQGELYSDSDDNLYVRGATNAEGLSRARFEMPIYNHKNSGQKKIDDDFVDALRGLMSTFGVVAAPLTKDERVEKIVEAKTPHLARKEVLKHLGKSDFAELQSARDHAIRQAKIEDERSDDELRNKLRSMFGSKPVNRFKRR